MKATKRTYGEGCAAAHALDLVGERWALLVVRELLLGPKRFTDLRGGIVHASPNVLAERLRDLEAAGVVRRRKLPPPYAARVYELTEWGQELEPVIISLGRWGSRSPSLPRGACMSVDSHILAMRTLFDAETAAGLDARVQLRLGDCEYAARVSGGELDVGPDTFDDPDATIATDAPTLASMLWEGRTLADALRAGDVSVGGDRAVVERFLGLFPLDAPEPVTA